MKVSSLALVAWTLLGQLAVAEDAPGLIPLPSYSRPSTTAQNAADAPRWTPAPSAAAAAPGAAAALPSAAPASAPSPGATAGLPNNVPTPLTPANTIPPSATAVSSGSGPNPTVAPSFAAPSAPAGLQGIAPGPSPTPAAAPQPAVNAAAQPPQRFSPSEDAKPLPAATADSSADAPNSSEAADQPRPLKSVMIHRAPKTPAATPAEPTSEITPTRYEEPLPPPAGAPAFAPNSSQTAPRSSAPLSVAQPAATTTAPMETPVDPEKAAAARAAADLLTSSFDSRSEAVTTISLLEAVAQAGETGRAAAIHDYWLLSRAWSDYHWAEDEVRQLEAVVPARNAVNSPMLSTAQAAAAARVNEAKLGIEAAQDALMRSAHLPIQAGSYRPTDAPLVGPYHTYFSVLFSNRLPPGRTLQIDRSLPLRLKAINDRAAAVQSASSAVHYAEEAHAKSDADMRTVLACHEALYHQRRAFLDEVMNYNFDIGEYATTVAPSGTPNEKLVGMLIDSKQADHMSAVPAEPTAATATGRNVSAANQRRNPNDGWVPSTMRTLEPSVGDRYRSSAR